MFRPRTIRAVIRPGSVEQVVEIVRRFADPLLHTSLFPVSTGRNWGLGSAEPPQDGVVRLELDRLDRIRALDIDAGWALVEPGVTQHQLAAALSGSDRMLNLTASSAHTSIIGNACDRGIGLHRPRIDDVAGLEVVLPDGHLIRTGWWPGRLPQTATYPSGLGPCPTGLFTQSNLGIVTAAAIKLLPRPESHRLMAFTFTSQALPRAVDQARRWFAQRLCTGIGKIFSPLSARSYGGPESAFLLHVHIAGAAGLVRAICALIEQEARAGEVLHAYPEPGPAGTALSRMLDSAYQGDPSHNDEVVAAALGTDADHADTEGNGWLFFTALAPLDGQRIAHAAHLLTEIGRDTGIEPGWTINVVDADTTHLVVSLGFDRTDDQRRRAHRALDSMHRRLPTAGFVPYRLDIDRPARMDELCRDAGALDFVRRLKAWLDPHQVLAPGRYP